MRQTQASPSRKEFLLSLCNDYNLPVSPADNEETLENFLKVVSDESFSSNQETSQDDVLEDDPVYIGRYESALLAYLKRVVTFGKLRQVS